MHELTCRSCGAALHNMKPMKVASPKKAAKSQKAYRDDFADFLPEGRKAKPAKPKKRKAPKRRRGFDFGDFLGDALEEVFDIFD